MTKWRTSLAQNNKIIRETLAKVKSDLDDESIKILMESVSLKLDTRDKVAKIINGQDKDVYEDSLEFW